MTVPSLSLRDYTVGSRAPELRRKLPARLLLATFIWFLSCTIIDLVLDAVAPSPFSSHLGLVVGATVWVLLALYLVFIVGVIEIQRRSSERLVRNRDGASGRTVFSVYLSDSVRGFIDEYEGKQPFSPLLTFVVLDFAPDGMHVWRPTDPPVEVIHVPWTALGAVNPLTDTSGNAYLRLTGSGTSHSAVDAHVADGSLRTKPGTTVALAARVEALRAH
jgi:hypothetical protein